MKLLLLLFITVLTAPLHESYNLVLDLKEGEIYKYVIIKKSESDVTGGPFPMNTVFDEERRFTVAIKEKINNGYKLSATCDWEKSLINLSGYEISYDSRDKDSKNQLFKPNNSGKTFEFIMLDDGKITEVIKAKLKGKRGEVESVLGFDQFMDIVSGAYPGKTVRIGDTWRDSMPAFAQMNYYFSNKYTLEKVEKGFAYISIYGKISTKEVTKTEIIDEKSPWGGASMFAYNKGYQKGLLIFNIKNGGLVKADIVQEVISETTFDPLVETGNISTTNLTMPKRNTIQINLIDWH